MDASQTERLARIEERVIGVAAQVDKLATRHEVTAISERVAKLETNQAKVILGVFSAVGLAVWQVVSPLFGKG
jgi:hypothetical protein